MQFSALPGTSPTPAMQLTLPGGCCWCVCCQVVVLTQRSKLEMEGIFWRCLPATKRYGTRLIFRQGSPLVPSGAGRQGRSDACSCLAQHAKPSEHVSVPATASSPCT
jgi:hypothetical protein